MIYYLAYTGHIHDLQYCIYTSSTLQRFCCNYQQHWDQHSDCSHMEGTPELVQTFL